MMRSDEERETKPGLRGERAGTEGEDSSMARSPGKARSDTTASQAAQRSEMSEGTRTVKSGNAPKSKEVESHNVMGEVEEVSAKGAEGVTDMASSKANRRENEEPERERDEKAAIKGGVRHSGTFGVGEGGKPAVGKNVMGSGFRETVAKNTI